MKAKSKLYLSQIVAAIPNGRPIIFWDTCAILEIFRLSERSNNPEQDFGQYSYLADKIESGDIVSVSSELVFNEFNQHYMEEFEALKRWEDKRRDDVRKITALMAHGRRRSRIERCLAEMHTESRVTSVVSKIWRNTIVIREEKKLLSFAYSRVKLKWAPSKNKEQFKDSYIWGTFLNLAHSLPHNYPQLFFFTLNTKDYFDPNTKKIDSNIVSDLNGYQDVELMHILGKVFGSIRRLFP